MVPKAVQWKDSATFLLSGSGKKLQLYLPTHEEAEQAVLKIKSSFPQVRVIEL